jgi:hypothetical protein
MRQSAALFNPQQAHAVWSSLWSAHIKPTLIAGQRLIVEVKPETRSDAQNRLLHSRISDIARQCEWAGRKWEIDQWKRLLTAAWCRVRSEGVEMVPALDGKGFDVLYQRTSKLSRRDCAELSEYVMAWGTEHNVEWSATSIGEEVA